MKKLLLFSIVCLFAGNIAAQTTGLGVQTTVTNATNCTAPCNGTATVTNVTGGTPPYTYLWNIPSNPQQTQTATGLCPGQYQVGVWDAATPFPNQGQALVTITCTTATGILDFFAEKGVNVFPNPASDLISVSLPAGQEVSALKILNVFGEVVYTETGNFSASTKISVGTLPAGIYFIECTNATEVFRSKFIKL